MSKTERKRIIGYIFRHPDTLEDIRQQFERWMLAREQEPEIDEILWEIWNTHTAPVSEEEDRKGLERLRASLRASRVRTLPRRVLRYASMAAAVVDSQGDTSVDAITSSTLSFSVKAVQEAVADCIAQAKA